MDIDDEWETPNSLLEYLKEQYNINPRFDACANINNSKCGLFYSDNALEEDWVYHPKLITDVWCNPPHSKTKDFVRKAYEQWMKYNINIMMIIPANSMCTNYAEEYIYPYAEYYPINRRLCAFLKNGKKLDHSRNGYFVVIWRKRNGKA